MGFEEAESQTLPVEFGFGSRPLEHGPDLERLPRGEEKAFPFWKSDRRLFFSGEAQVSAEHAGNPSDKLEERFFYDFMGKRSWYAGL